MLLDIKKISAYLHVPSFLILVDLHLLNVGSSFMANIFYHIIEYIFATLFIKSSSRKKPRKIKKCGNRFRGRNHYGS